jgi:hypothetical protein
LPAKTGKLNLLIKKCTKMKNLNLDALGVKGLNDAEISETNGGGIVAVILIGFLVTLAWDIAMNPSDAASAFCEGAEERMSMNK